ncbi:MAG TPA: IclR family transcriptional regulator [Armatimonadota bacterium]
MADTSYDVPAVRKAIGLLTLLSQTETPLGVSEVSRALGINKNMAFRLLATLRDEGWVLPVTDEPKYRLSLRPFQVASQSVARMQLGTAAEAPLRALWQDTGESCYLGTLYDDQALFVAHLDGTGAVKIAGRVGGCYPLQCAAAGTVLLAYGGAALFTRVTAHGLQRFTAQTLADPTSLRADLDAITARGWALDNEEHGRGIICAAAPVFDHQSLVIGAVGVSVTTISYTAEDVLAQLVPRVCAASAAISRVLGYAPRVLER